MRSVGPRQLIKKTNASAYNSVKYEKKKNFVKTVTKILHTCYDAITSALHNRVRLSCHVHLTIASSYKFTTLITLYNATLKEQETRESERAARDAR